MSVLLPRWLTTAPVCSNMATLLPFSESRHLSRFTMRVNQQQLLLLSSTIREDNAFLSVDLTNLDSPVNSDDTLPRGTVHIFRLQFLREASCYQHIRLLNYDRQPVRVSLFLQFDADFADIFEVRGTKRARKGERLPDQATQLSGDCNAILTVLASMSAESRRPTKPLMHG